MGAISVNGIEIAEAAVAAEMQHHPAPSQAASRKSAAQALAIRTLLMARANALGLKPAPEIDEQGKRETVEDALIRQLLEAEVKIPIADEESCERYYENNQERFKSPEIFEASHILFSAASGDPETFAQAVLKAEAVLETLKRDPSLFEELARKLSDCPSAAQGGNLGQITRGQTTPEFETFLLTLEEGQLCPVPVKTRYGVHALRLHRRVKGKLLPFEAVKDRIAAFLNEWVWRSAIAQYIGLLLAGAKVEGLGTPAPSSR